MSSGPLWALVPDLMLKSRIAGLARAENLTLRFFARPADVIAALEPVAEGARPPGAAEGAPPSLLIVDLHAPGEAGFALLDSLRDLRTAGRSPPPVLAFFSHVDVGTRERAIALEADRVVPRSALVGRFAHWVKEHVRQPDVR